MVNNDPTGFDPIETSRQLDPEAREAARLVSPRLGIVDSGLDKLADIYHIIGYPPEVAPTPSAPETPEIPNNVTYMPTYTDREEMEEKEKQEEEARRAVDTHATSGNTPGASQSSSGDEHIGGIYSTIDHYRQKQVAEEQQWAGQPVDEYRKAS